MCEVHGEQVGHVCGSEPDSIDYCPHHVAETTREPLKSLAMFPSEVEGVRREIHANALRSRMRAAPI